MNIKQFEDHLRKQVLAERKAYLESRKSFSETKDLNILDEGVMDAIASLIGRSETAQRFFAGRYLSYMGVPTSSKLYAPFMAYIADIDKVELQKLFNGEAKARKHFAEYSTLLTLQILQNDFTDIFGLNEKTHIGGALLDAIQSAIDSDSFKEAVRGSIYDSLMNVSKDNFSAAEKELDGDEDGIDNAVEKILGSDSNKPDDIEAIKTKLRTGSDEPPPDIFVPADPKEVEPVKTKVAKKKKKAEPEGQLGLFGQEPVKKEKEVTDELEDKDEDTDDNQAEEGPQKGNEEAQQTSLFEESSPISSELLQRILDQ